MPGWVELAFDEYRRRLPREIDLELVEIPLARRGKKPEPEKIKQGEGKALLDRSLGCTRIALDENGKNWSSVELSEKLARWMEVGRDVALLVGGPDGHNDQTLKQMDESWSLSRLTLPHGMIRPIVAEQLYRAWSILSNHPYHRV